MPVDVHAACSPPNTHLGLAMIGSGVDGPGATCTR